MHAPGPLLASGRDSDIFEYGPGLVLRRSREGHSMTDEARIMEYVHAQGYPIPAVDEISDDGTDLVMERVDGPSMVAAMTSRPWTIPRHGRTLARLHKELHAVEAPAWMPPSRVGLEGDRIVHLDLHPLNVIISRRGPVVIDWPSASRGIGETDVALTWVLIASGEVPTGRLLGKVLGRARATFTNSFLKEFDLATIGPHVRSVVDWKLRDPHMSPVECERMRGVARSISQE